MESEKISMLKGFRHAGHSADLLVGLTLIITQTPVLHVSKKKKIKNKVEETKRLRDIKSERASGKGRRTGERESERKEVNSWILRSCQP